VVALDWVDTKPPDKRVKLIFLKRSEPLYPDFGFWGVGLGSGRVDILFFQDRLNRGRDPHPLFCAYP
jgi:hypothetical protein